MDPSANPRINRATSSIAGCSGPVRWRGSAQAARATHGTRATRVQPESRLALQVVPELLPELRGELVIGEPLVLRAVVLDLQRAHQVADAADGRPVEAAQDAEDQAG